MVSVAVPKAMQIVGNSLANQTVGCTLNNTKCWSKLTYHFGVTLENGYHKSKDNDLSSPPPKRYINYDAINWISDRT